MEEITTQIRSLGQNIALLKSRKNMIGRTGLVLFLYQWEDKTKNIDFVLRQRITGTFDHFGKN